MRYLLTFFACLVCSLLFMSPLEAMSKEKRVMWEISNQWSCYKRGRTQPSYIFNFQQMTGISNTFFNGNVISTEIKLLFKTSWPEYSKSSLSEPLDASTNIFVSFTFIEGRQTSDPKQYHVNLINVLGRHDGRWIDIFVPTGLASIPYGPRDTKYTKSRSYSCSPE